MLSRIIEIATPGTRLNVRDRQLIISRPDHPAVSRPLEDLGVVIVDDIQATYTQATLIGILEAGGVLVTCDHKHLPTGILLSLQGSHALGGRQVLQAKMKKPFRKRVWQAIVQSKIRQQASVLKCFTGTDCGLAAMARRVRSGDPNNIEAQAAQRYWPRLMGAGFRRDRDAAGANQLLNYGYTVVRASVARALTAAGLNPALGVHHHRTTNPFCLADDLIEPYRPLVDWTVRRETERDDTTSGDLADRETRARVLSLLNRPVSIGERAEPIHMAIMRSATSLAMLITDQGHKLLLPTGLPGDAGEEPKRYGQ